RLVTAEGTRARRTEAELLTDGGQRSAERTALEALVRGRVVVANSADRGAYEIAHEALLVSWSTLQGWLQRDAADHGIRRRIEHAGAEWERLGRPRDLLWARRQLATARGLDRETMAPRDLAFLDASHGAVVRTRVLGLGAAAILAIAAVVVGLTIRARARRELESVIANQMLAATTAFDSATHLATQRDAARARAFSLFGVRRWTEGEDAWTEVEEIAAREASQFRAASGYFESALSLDPARASLRAQFADLTFQRLLRAERDHQRDLVDELAGRLVAYDDGRYRAALGVGARIELTAMPPGTMVWSERPGGARQLLGQAPLAPLELPPGSLTLSFEAPGRVAARLPLLLARGETLKQRITLPTAQSAPPGMIYVPPGRFLFGSADGTDLRRGFL
ncbi:MAG: protein kinase domain-containing protein, partial [Solirubrobacteraceae bacterium]